jgi:hypothetical protein
VNWLWTWAGLRGAGAPYSFWSGIGSDITEFALFTVLWRRFNCHAKGCWRLGIHRVDGTHFTTCRAHHPLTDGPAPATAEQIARAHADAVR